MKARHDLKNWVEWKRTIELLEETKEQLIDMRKAISMRNHQELAGGQHLSIHSKMQRVIEECEQYDIVIKEYKFFVNRLEKAINTLLNKDEKDVIIIYVNNPTNTYKREKLANEKGISRSAYYNLLNSAIDKLNTVIV